VAQVSEVVTKHPAKVAVGSVLVLAGCSRLHITRYLRKAFMPGAFVFLALRYSSRSDTSDSIISLFLRVFKSPALNRLVGDALGLALLGGIFSSTGGLLAFNLNAISAYAKDQLFSLVKFLPQVKRELDKERKNLDATLKSELKSKVAAMGEVLRSLPESGRTSSEVLAFMQEQVQREDSIWLDGKVSGSVYHGIKEHQDVLNQAFGYYSLSNPLHPEIWPSMMKYDSEIIAMTASLVNGGIGSVCGCTSSGGTESIILAIKAHRDYYRESAGINDPELVSCTSAHAAVDKACNLMGIRHIKVPMDPATFQCDLRGTRIMKCLSYLLIMMNVLFLIACTAMERAIGPNTIMLYGKDHRSTFCQLTPDFANICTVVYCLASAPGYPQGVIDPVAAMGQLAVKYQIGLHVDCCLGGFVLPFAKKLGYDIPGSSLLFYSFILRNMSSL
jgi:hypothetical protein